MLVGFQEMKVLYLHPPESPGEGFSCLFSGVGALFLREFEKKSNPKQHPTLAPPDIGFILEVQLTPPQTNIEPENGPYWKMIFLYSPVVGGVPCALRAEYLQFLGALSSRVRGLHDLHHLPHFTRRHQAESQVLQAARKGHLSRASVSQGFFPKKAHKTCG